MGLRERTQGDKKFRVLVVGALYSGIGRGLAADVMAAQGLGGTPLTVCTTLVAAGMGRVTDVIEVPADSVDAQLEHVLETLTVDAAKIGIVGSAATVPLLFRRLEHGFDGPLVLDLTLSGPSGEDIANQNTLDALRDRLSIPDLVTLRRRDAELVAGMEIQSLDDAQVAAQRLARQGAEHVLLRCGALPARFFDGNGKEEPYYADLYFDGTDFALFEGPALDRPGLHGASSALTLAILANLSLKRPLIEAIQAGKAYVTEALRHTTYSDVADLPNFVWAQPARRYNT